MFSTKEHRLINQRRVPTGQLRKAAEERAKSPQVTQQKSGVGVSRVGVGRPETVRTARPGQTVQLGTDPTVRRAPVPQGTISPRRDRFEATTETEITPGRGIRPGQFGEIDEAAGERVTFDRDPTTGLETPIVRDAQGNELRRFAQIQTPQSIGIGQRAEPGAPLESPRAGAGGRPGALGFTPERFAAAQPGRFQIQQFGAGVAGAVDPGTAAQGFRTGGDVQSQIAEQQKFVADISGKDVQQRLKDAGVSEESSKLLSVLESVGITDLTQLQTGSVDGRLSIVDVKDPALIQALTDAGIRFEQTTKDGHTNLLLAIGEADFAADARAAKDITEGKDIEAANQGLNILTQDLSNVEEQERQQALFREQQAQQAGLTPEQAQKDIDRAKDTGATDTAMKAAINFANDGTPEGGIISGLMQGAQDAVAGNEALLRESAGLQVEQAQDSFSAIRDLLNKGQQRSTLLFNDSAGLLEDVRDRKVKLAAEQEELADQQLKWSENKLVRESKQQLTDDIDNRYSALALSGGFGSSNGLEEVAQARTRGEQAITDLQKEFGFKRADLNLSYTALVNQAEETYSTNVLTAANNLENRLAQIDLQGVANIQAKDTAIRSAIQNMGNEITKERRAKADRYTAAAKTIQEQIAAAQKAKQDGIIKTGDTISFTSDITKEINANKFIADARQVDTRFRSIEAALQAVEDAEGAGDTKAKNFADQSLINLFNKITDPTSVVRESEFARSAAGLSLMQRFEAGFRKIQEGGVLEPDARRELRDAAKVIADEYNAQLERDIQPYIARINMFNSQPDVQTKVKLTDVIPSNLIPQVPQATLDTWKVQMGGSQASTGAEGALPGFSSPESAPKKGFRTDRHNNPTAFTTGIARQAGLVEGEDYEVGDPFPNNPNMKTARLLKDPIETTIQVIDDIGFHTKGGQKRWTHTAMSKDSWNALTKDQKANVVSQMYQREGGTGVLVEPTQIAAEATVEEGAQIAAGTGGIQRGGVLAGPTGTLEVQETAEFRGEGGGIIRVNIKDDPERFKALQDSPNVTFLQFK